MDLPEYRNEKVAFETTMKWINEWNEVLIIFGLGAMDLSNHPDRLKTHVLYLDLSPKRPRPQERAQWMTMNEGYIIPVPDLLTRLRGMRMPEDRLELIGSLPPVTDGAPEDVLQVCVNAHITVRLYKCGVNHVQNWKTIPKEVSAWRAATWEERLKARINEGRLEPW